MYKQDLKGAIGLVMGNEAHGVSELVKKKCDFTASIPMYGDIDSLNVSVAAGRGVSVGAVRVMDCHWPDCGRLAELAAGGGPPAPVHRARGQRADAAGLFRAPL